MEVVVRVVGKVEEEGQVLLVILVVDEGIGRVEPFLFAALCLQLPGPAVFGELAF